MGNDIRHILSMDNQEFKKIFNQIAKNSGFESTYSGWFKESKECILVLDLQKSNFGNYYYMNIKIYIQGVFGKNYTKSKELVKKEIGNLFRRQPKEYDNLFDLDSTIGVSERKEGLEAVFREFINPFSTKALTRKGVKELAKENKIALLPAVEREINL